MISAIGNLRSPEGIAGRRKHHWQKKINRRLTIAGGKAYIRFQRFPGPVFQVRFSKSGFAAALICRIY
jgi:hypothetical protein